MVTIKTISKCFKEVKRLTGDLLSDSQVNQILDESGLGFTEEYTSAEYRDLLAQGPPKMGDEEFGDPVGKDGWFAGFFSFQIQTVQDVIQRYDEICEVISHWPIFPEEQNFISPDGVEIWISVKKLK